MQKTFFATPQETERNWVIVDLENKVLGRAASKIANLLRGKDKATFTPHIDTGCFVIAINASKVHLTGRKWDAKMYYDHSGYPGGLKEKTAQEVLDREPERLIRDAVWGMLPKNTLSKHQLAKLKIYSGADHPHVAQSPKSIEL
ncbi:MAG: 50S ribosomal protein L13 [Pseudomonadota bacterium]